jgi:uncharacterized protein YpbB
MNIEKMEDISRQFIPFTEKDIRLFMKLSISLHKDHIERMAKLEKEWAEHLEFLQTNHPENYGGTD